MKTNRNTHHEKIRRCFNLASSTYDDFCQPQQFIGNELINLLRKHTSQIRSIIDVGCGTGLITEKLHHAICVKNFYAIDISDQFLLKAKQRLNGYSINIYNQNFESFHFKEILFDTIFANMSLHWSSAWEKTLTTLHSHLSENGILAFSVPLAGSLVELPAESRNHFHSCSEILDYLAHAGFKIIEYSDQVLTYQFDSWKQAIQSIKAVGANYLFSNKKNALSRKKFYPLSEKITSDASLTYRVGFFIAKVNTHVL